MKTTTLDTLTLTFTLLTFFCTQASAQDIKEEEHNKVVNVPGTLPNEFKPKIYKRSDRFTGATKTYLRGNLLPKNTTGSSFIILLFDATTTELSRGKQTAAGMSLDLLGYGLGVGPNSVDFWIDGKAFPNIEGKSGATASKERRIVINLSANLAKAIAGAKKVQIRFLGNGKYKALELAPENIAAFKSFVEVTKGKPVPAKYKD